MTEPERLTWELFKSWHKDAKLWREIYTRMVAGLAALFVAYLVGAYAGTFSRRPLIPITVVFSALSVLSLGQALDRYRSNRHRFTDHPDMAASTKRSLYVAVGNLVLQATLLVIAVFVLNDS